MSKKQKTPIKKTVVVFGSEPLDDTLDDNDPEKYLYKASVCTVEDNLWCMRDAAEEGLVVLEIFETSSWLDAMVYYKKKYFNEIYTLDPSWLECENAEGFFYEEDE